MKQNFRHISNTYYILIDNIKNSEIIFLNTLEELYSFKLMFEIEKGGIVCTNTRLD